jgi:hypothetical protein
MQAQIINVDLGQSVEDIINAAICRLTENERTALDAAVTAAAALPPRTQLPFANTLEKIVQALLTNNSLTGAQLLELSAPELTQLSSLIQRLKNYLRHHPQELSLISTKIRGIRHYRLRVHSI